MYEDDEDYDDYEDEDDDEEESERLILSIGEDGTADIYKESDYVSVFKEDFMLMKNYIDEHAEDFAKYVEKQKQSSLNNFNKDMESGINERKPNR